MHTPRSGSSDATVKTMRAGKTLGFHIPAFSNLDFSLLGSARDSSGPRWGKQNCTHAPYCSLCACTNPRSALNELSNHAPIEPIDP